MLPSASKIALDSTSASASTIRREMTAKSVNPSILIDRGLGLLPLMLTHVSRVIVICMHGDVTSTESCTYSLAKRVEEFASVANTTRPGDFVTIVGRASTATRPKL